MSGGHPPVDLIFLWHHHQPDYRSPRNGRAMLPWVRLHATKDYLDMARGLARHPRVRATFNFVPSLLDQIDSAAAGGPDALFDLLRRPISDLGMEDLALLATRLGALPRHARERWPQSVRLSERAARSFQNHGAAGAMSEAEWITLETWFLLAWIDPMFLDAPEAQAAIAAHGVFEVAHRDQLLALHDRLLSEVVPAYRALAESGQIEISVSPYYHPILPLLIDIQSARRARPEIGMPAEAFAAPDDATRQIESALRRHQNTFGMAATGMWPPEGSVSPEAVAAAARCGVKWLATDEGVLWPSLPPEARKREALYRPWKVETPDGPVTLFFRDRELSDRIGFVYYHWEASQAVEDFIERVRKIGRDHAGGEPPVVSVILDGENCWEHYPEDGGPFLEALYQALENAPDIRTVRPCDLLASGRSTATIPHLHSGSWINGDFRIWIGHPEKNRAWDLLSRARRTLAERGVRLPMARGRGSR